MPVVNRFVEEEINIRNPIRDLRSQKGCVDPRDAFGYRRSSIRSRISLLFTSHTAAHETPSGSIPDIHLPPYSSSGRSPAACWHPRRGRQNLETDPPHSQYEGHEPVPSSDGPRSCPPPRAAASLRGARQVLLSPQFDASVAEAMALPEPVPGV